MVREGQISQGVRRGLPNCCASTDTRLAKLSAESASHLCIKPQSSALFAFRSFSTHALQQSTSLVLSFEHASDVASHYP